MKTKSNIERDEEGTAYITDADGKTRVYAIEMENDEGWVLERQKIGGDENPERLSFHRSEREAMAELAGYAPNTYRIYTDSGSEEIQAATLADALSKWGESPARVTTTEEFEAWLKDVGGFGGIQENGLQIANVRA